MDKFESLKAFTQVVEAGSFAEAARQMQLSRAAVNKSVINLEKQLGVQLFNRSTRSVRPTDTGKAYYEKCVAILDDLAEADRAVSQLQDEPRGNLRLNAPMSFGTIHLASALADFMVQYPKVHMQVTLEDRFVDPIAEGFDLVVRIGTPPSSAALVAHRISKIHRVLCAAPSYLAVHGSPHHPNQLRDHSCLHYGYLPSGSQWRFLGPDGECAISIQGSLCSNNGEVLKVSAVKGLGIAMLPEFIVADEVQSGLLQVLLPDYSLPEIFLCAIYPTNRHLSTKVKLLTAFLQERFEP